MAEIQNRLAQILWAAPAERRFGSGDVLTEENLAAAGIDLDHLLDAKEAQLVDPADYAVTRVLDPLPVPEPTEEERIAEAQAAAEAAAKAEAEAAAKSAKKTA